MIHPLSSDQRSTNGKTRRLGAITPERPSWSHHICFIYCRSIYVFPTWLLDGVPFTVLTIPYVLHLALHLSWDRVLKRNSFSAPIPRDLSTCLVPYPDTTTIPGSLLHFESRARIALPFHCVCCLTHAREWSAGPDPAHVFVFVLHTLVHWLSWFRTNPSLIRSLSPYSCSRPLSYLYLSVISSTCLVYGTASSEYSRSPADSTLR